MRVWRVLSFDNRQYAGNRGYADDVRRLYEYDNFVANCLQASKGDILFVFNLDQLVGLGRIEAIDTEVSKKVRQRCPRCARTSIKERKRLTPLFRCQECKFEFDKAVVDEVECTLYKAHYENTFVPATLHMSRDQVRAACLRWSDQLSIQEMDQLAAVSLVRRDLLLLDLISDSAVATPEIEDAETAVGERSSGRKPRPYRQSSEERQAIEQHAMKAALAYYGIQGWSEVRDVHGHESYDLQCSREGSGLHVEVKGTTGDGSEVLLTKNVAHHARRYYPNVALFILAGVEVRRDMSDKVVALGGDKIVLEPWRIDAGELSPIGFRYAVPPNEWHSGGIGSVSGVSQDP